MLGLAKENLERGGVASRRLRWASVSTGTGTSGTSAAFGGFIFAMGES